jgi:hypothetical protein
MSRTAVESQGPSVSVRDGGRRLDHAVVRNAPRRIRNRPVGRPTLLDGRTREGLLTAIRAGNRLPAAARFASVSPTTFAEWMRRGRGEDVRPATREYVELVEAVEQAQAEAEVAAVAAIRRAMRRDWRAAAWFLENVAPEWRRRKDGHSDQAPAQPPPTVVGQVVLVQAETLRRIAAERTRAERGDVDPDEETLARRALLVSGHPASS